MVNRVPNPNFCLDPEQMSYVLTSFIASSLPNQKVGIHKADINRINMMRDGRIAYLEKEALNDLQNAILSSREQGYDQLLCPTSIFWRGNKNFPHSVALNINHRNKSVTYIDSLGEEMPDNVRRNISRLLNGYTFDEYYNVRQQGLDDTSCTIWTVDNLYKMANNIGIEEKPLREFSADLQDIRTGIQGHLRDVWWPEKVRKHNSQYPQLLRDFQLTHPNLNSETRIGQLMDEQFFEIGFKFFKVSERGDFIKLPVQADINSPPHTKHKAFFAHEITM